MMYNYIVLYIVFISLLSNVMLNFTCKHMKKQYSKNIWVKLGKGEENELLLSYYCD